MTALWKNLKSSFAHAFAVPSGKEPFSEEELALLDKAAGFVVKKRMSAPAVLFLESLRPLSFIGSQAMVFLQPVVASFFSPLEYERLAQILERRESIGLFIERIQESQDKKVKKRCKKENVLENIGNIRLSEWIEQFNEGAQILGDARDMEKELEELVTELEEVIEGGDAEEDEIADLRDETEELEEEIQVYYRDALALFVNATDISPDSAHGWINMGISY